MIDGGVRSAILAVGYRSEQILRHFGERYRSLPLRYSLETQPLGTGGAVSLAMKHVGSDPVFVINGDTYVELDFARMLAAHLDDRTRFTVAVRTVRDVSRYGALDIDDSHVRGFFEKGRSGPGTINAGVYLLSRELLDAYAYPPAYSLETDLLAQHVRDIRPLTFPVSGHFIDIGVPEDYALAQRLLA